MIQINKDDITRIRPNAIPDKNISKSKHAMVSTAFPDATNAGVHVLNRGGNAIDAACAAALCLCVCEPQASGIGGQSIAIMHVNGRTISVDGSSRAPALARPSLFDVYDVETGYMATTIPSTISTLGYMQKEYGVLEWADVLEPAIRVARQGYRITKLQHILQSRHADDLIKTGSGAHYFLKDGVVPYDPGDLFVQEDLADTLEYISSDHALFYTGVISDAIDSDMQKNRGLVRKTDLEKFGEPALGDCISTTYRDVPIYTVMTPGSGPTLLLSLNVLNMVPSKFLKHYTPESFLYMANATRLSQEYHVQKPIRPDLDRLDDVYFGLDAARTIHRNTFKSNAYAQPNSEDTTHLSVMDDEGNAVGITQSIETVYGSKVAAEGMGFLYNSYISTYDMRDTSHPFHLRPGNVPWSSVCPSILFRNGLPWMVVGSPGSSRISSTMCQFISGVLDGDLSIYGAMERARLYYSSSDNLHLEQDDFMMHCAQQSGHSVVMRHRYSFYMGAIHAVVSCDDGFEGVAEVRRDGNARGV